MTSNYNLTNYFKKTNEIGQGTPIGVNLRLSAVPSNGGAYTRGTPASSTR